MMIYGAGNLALPGHCCVTGLPHPIGFTPIYIIGDMPIIEKKELIWLNTPTLI